MTCVIVDAEGRILGRMAVQVAERLQDGDEVFIVNSEQAVVTGNREKTFASYRKKRERGSREKGPFYPKAPDRIVKRTIRSMLPDNTEGQEAFKRLRTYTGNPDGLDVGEDTIDSKTVADLKGRNYVSINEISAHM